MHVVSFFLNFHNSDYLGLFAGFGDLRCPMSIPWGTRLRRCWCIALVVLQACTAWKSLVFHGGVSGHILFMAYLEIVLQEAAESSHRKQLNPTGPRGTEAFSLASWCHPATTALEFSSTDPIWMMCWEEFHALRCAGLKVGWGITVCLLFALGCRGAVKTI